jgi:tetratricopeptide (TPR) repeat protein
MIAAEHDNLARAAELVAQAIELDPAQPGWHAQLGRLRIAQHDPQAALFAARRGLALQPDDALTLDTLGVVLSRAGSHDEAVSPFRQAVARAPGTSAYWYNLGAAEQFVGRFPEATAAYRQALALDPDCFKALSALTEVSSEGLTIAETRALESALTRSDLTPDDELHLCHALARIHERAGRAEEAMRALSRGKHRKRASLGRRPGEDQALFEAVLRTCTPEFLRHSDGFETTEPLFIVGMPRSGTTLVERILSSHPAVTSAGELMHFSLAVKRAAGTPSNRVLDVATIDAAPTLDWRAIGRTYLDSTRPRTGGTSHFVDKMPLNFLYAAMIRRALPNARIVCVRRGAADTCLSNYRQLFATGFSYYDYAYDLADTARYVAGFEEVTRHWRQVLGPNYLEIHYENVVAELETESRRLLAFCHLEWDPACLEFHLNAAPVSTASSVQVRSPIYATSVGRWRRYQPLLAPAIAVLTARGIPLE